MECENTYNPSFSRVRVRAYIQEFLFFCCHKCHRFLCKQLETSLLSYPFERFLTVYQCIPSKSQCRTLEKCVFLLSYLLHSPPYFPHLIFPTFPSELPLRVTLVTAKKHNCGWNVRAYACARETPRLSVLLPLSSTSILMPCISSLNGTPKGGAAKTNFATPPCCCLRVLFF